MGQKRLVTLTDPGGQLTIGTGRLEIVSPSHVDSQADTHCYLYDSVIGRLLKSDFTSGGFGYINGEAATITGGTGSGCTGMIMIGSEMGPTGAITECLVTDGGTGYVDGESIGITGDESTASNATGVVSVTSGIITKITFTTTGGTGFVVSDTITITGATSGAVASGDVTKVDGSGQIKEINITDPGALFESGEELTITGGTGSGALASAGIGKLIYVIGSDRGSYQLDIERPFKNGIWAVWDAAADYDGNILLT